MRNFLLSQASGEFSIMLDGDDYYINNVDQAIDFLQKGENYIGYCFNFSKLDAKENKILKNEPLSTEPRDINLNNHVYNDLYVHANCIVFKTNSMRNETWLKLNQNDTLFTTFLLSKGRVRYSPVNLMVYRIGLPSLYSGNTSIIKMLLAAVSLELLAKQVLIANSQKALKFCKIFLISSYEVFKNQEISESELNNFIELIKNEELMICHYIVSCIQKPTLVKRITFNFLKILARVFYVGIMFWHRR